MFSIEKTLQDALNFGKNFFSAFWKTITSPRKTLHSLIFDYEYIKINPVLFCCICLFAMIEYARPNVIFFNESVYNLYVFSQSLVNFNFIENFSIWLPIIILIYSFIYIYSKALRLNSCEYKVINDYSSLWFGSSIIFYILTDISLKILYEFSFKLYLSINVFHDSFFNIQKYIYLIARIALSLITIYSIGIVTRWELKQFFKFSIIPFFIYFSVYLAFKILRAEQNLFRPPSNQTQNINLYPLPEGRSYMKNINLICHIDTLLNKVNIEAFIYSKSKKTLFLRNNIGFYIRGKDSDMNKNDQIFDFFLSEYKLGGSSLEKHFIKIEPNEIKYLDLKGDISRNVKQEIVNNSIRKTNAYRFRIIEDFPEYKFYDILCEIKYDFLKNETRLK